MSEETQVNKFEFDEAFQTKIVTMCLRDEQFARRTDGLIRPEYFENVLDGYIVRTAHKYYEDYKELPKDLATFAQAVKDAIDKKIVRKEDAKDVLYRARDIWNRDVSDREYVIDTVSVFARYQAVTNALIDIAEKKLDFGDFDGIQKSLEKALSVGANAESKGYDFFAEAENRIDERIRRASGKLPPTGITTGYPDLDKHLLPHKGWGRYELSMLMGPAKVGKSTALMNFGLNACMSLYHYNVLYVTLEVSKAIIANRADARIAKIATNALDTSPQKTKDALLNARSRSGKFIIEDWPTGSMRVSDLRRIIEKYKSDGLVFDLIVVDYVDLMIPEKATSNLQEDSKNVNVALRAIATTEGCAILTATQTNRTGAQKVVATMTDVAEDFNKVRIADALITINATDEEKRMNLARLYLAALRNAPSGFTIKIEQDIEKMQFIKSVIGVE